MNERETLARIQSVIDFVWDNAYSSFYREHWGAHGIKERPVITSLDDFNARIPTLTKDDLLKRPHPDARCFIPRKDVRSLVSTSGTTSGQPLYRWHTHHKVASIYKDMYAAGCRSELYAWSYHRSAPLVSASTARTGIQTIVADPRQGDELIRHLHSRPIELISSTPSVALMIADRVGDVAILKKVQFLICIGEVLTPTTLSLLSQKYPNASVYNIFSFSETGCDIMVHTPTCSDTYDILHVETENVFADIAEDTLLCVTTLEVPHPTPLIRYVSGDAVARVGRPPAGGAPPFRALATRRKRVCRFRKDTGRRDPARTYRPRTSAS